MKVKRICFVFSAYPYKEESIWAFVRPLVCAIADLGVECTVIAPQSITRQLYRKMKYRPRIWTDFTDNNKKIKIYQPVIVTFSNIFKKFNHVMFRNAVKRVIDKYELRPDIIYSHFWENAVIVSSVLPGVPHVVATGEDRIWVRDVCSVKDIEFAIKNIKGIISVSSKNLFESKELNLLKFNPPTIILPNAYNPNDFFSTNRSEIRYELEFPQNDFIVSFVGSFDDRKGVNRLVKAVEGLDGVKLVLIGSGSVDESKQILYKGKVMHKELYRYLNASDIFVLPTRAEGCSNAIIEAIACNLPIVSSNRDFNADILDDKYSIRIDPDDISLIRESILKLKNNVVLREEMSSNAAIKKKTLTINERARKILSFLEQCI